MIRKDVVWQQAELSQVFLEGVRGAIPLAKEQIAVMLKIMQMARSPIENFLDLGCGDGILGRAILSKYPDAKGIFLDFSEPMIEAAKSKLDRSDRIEFIIADFGRTEWVEALADKYPFDAIVSGFAIHHQSDERKKEIYAEIYNLLKPGGIFLNLEHVASASPWLEKVSDELFVDSLYEFHQTKGSELSKEAIAHSYYHRPDKAANILAPVELQCDWLREIGFINVDCYFKIFELALFGGMRT
ncbi:MAG: class I SAM-dependent methyltransferase [Cyanosarcina radialis HA8281-LM2]|jgi:ubiquinone/menaquinone biosynthesis C-methylase UbiE|nr:class I SAM-dependent methyltransferase [Cyanosarcina radialis HA8281-LM2]